MILRKKDKEHIIALAERHLKTHCELWAYGSRVTGKAHDCSDLDLVVHPKNNAPLNVSEITDFQQALENSTIPILIQVMRWDVLPNPFHQNIIKNHEVMFSN